MKLRWLPIVLGVSVLANVALAVGWFGQVVSEGMLESHTRSTFRLMAGERAQLQAMRAQFCPANPVPDRAAVIAWDSAQRNGDHTFEKDGLLWINLGVGVQFDADDRLTGVCLPETWARLESPSLEDQDRAGELCPMEPLCGSGG